MSWKMSGGLAEAVAEARYDVESGAVDRDPPRKVTYRTAIEIHSGEEMVEFLKARFECCMDRPSYKPRLPRPGEFIRFDSEGYVGIVTSVDPTTDHVLVFFIDSEMDLERRAVHWSGSDTKIISEDEARNLGLPTPRLRSSGWDTF